MLKIRLKRFGRKKRPFYRIVLMDSRKKRDGEAIDELGFYNPITKLSKVDTSKIEKEIKNGAQLTKTVKRFIKI